MTVIYKRNENISPSEVIYANSKAVQKIAAQMIVDTIEGNIDMIMDMPEEYPTKRDIEKVLNSAKDQCLEMFDDYMDTLRESLKKKLEDTKFTVHVSRIDYSKTEDEYEDIHVEVDVE